MVSNIVLHETQPRNVAYDSDSSPLYSIKSEVSYINSKGSTVFAGSDQVGLFLTCMGLAKHQDLKPKTLKKREANIPTNAMGKDGRWLILALGMADTENLSCLNDEAPIYKEAEKYANAGLDCLKELIDAEGAANFGVYLEGELRDIAEDFILEEAKDEMSTTDESAESEDE